jgi:hypothetical protein
MQQAIKAQAQDVITGLFFIVEVYSIYPEVWS